MDQGRSVWNVINFCDVANGSRQNQRVVLMGCSAVGKSGTRESSIAESGWRGLGNLRPFVLSEARTDGSLEAVWSGSVDSGCA